MEEDQKENRPMNSATDDGAPKLSEEILRFAESIESIASSLPLVMATMIRARKAAGQEHLGYLRAKCEVVLKDDEGTLFRVPPELQQAASKYRRRVENFKKGCEILPPTFIVALVSQFDFFLGRLLRCLYRLKPEVLNASEKQLSFGEVLKFESLDAAKEYIVEKEIEGVLRKSHVEQFEWLETKFKLPLRKGLPTWASFVELTERRNLFVHCDGKVSHQYLSVCEANGVKFDCKPQIGEQLKSSRQYFDNAYRTIFEIGVKLAQVLLRKPNPDKLRLADANLLYITYDCLVFERYDLCRILGEFARETVKKFHSEELRLALLVNEAIAYKLSGEGDQCRALLSKVDWSAYAHKFKLAVAVLHDDFDQAATYVEEMGANSEIGETEYRDWPLFSEFRSSEKFQGAFAKVFGKPFLQEEEVKAKEIPDDGMASSQSSLAPTDNAVKSLAG